MRDMYMPPLERAPLIERIRLAIRLLCTCNRLEEAEEKASMWDGIVRCEECARYDTDAGFCLRFREIADDHRDLDWSYQLPEWGHLESGPYDFCSFGERREES